MSNTVALVHLIPNIHITVEFTDSERERIDQKKWFGSFFINALLLDTKLMQSLAQGLSEQNEQATRQYVKSLAEQITTYGATGQMVQGGVLEHWVKSVQTMLSLPKGPMEAVQMNGCSIILVDEPTGKRPIVSMSFKTQDLGQMPFLQESEDLKQYIKKLQAMIASHPMVRFGYASEQFSDYLISIDPHLHALKAQMMPLVEHGGGVVAPKVEGINRRADAAFLVSVAVEPVSEKVRPLSRLQSQLGNANGSKLYAQHVQELDLVGQLERMVQKVKKVDTLGDVQDLGEQAVNSVHGHQLTLLEQQRRYWSAFEDQRQEWEDFKKDVDLIEPVWVALITKKESVGRSENSTTAVSTADTEYVKKLWCITEGVESFGFNIPSSDEAKKQNQIEFQAFIAKKLREDLDVWDPKVVCQYKKGIGHIVRIDQDQMISKWEQRMQLQSLIPAEEVQKISTNLCSEILLSNQIQGNRLGLDESIEKSVLQTIEAQSSQKANPVVLMFKSQSLEVSIFFKKGGTLECSLAEPLIQKWKSEHEHWRFDSNHWVDHSWTRNGVIRSLYERSALSRSVLLELDQKGQMSKSMGGIPVDQSVSDLIGRLESRRKDAGEKAQVRNSNRL